MILSEVSHPLLVAGAPCVHPYLGKWALRPEPERAGARGSEIRNLGPSILDMWGIAFVRLRRRSGSGSGVECLGLTGPILALCVEVGSRQGGL
jgi:hypothetical protein